MDTEKPQPADEDQALMMRARNDDREAFAELVRRHQKMLLNHFMRQGVQYSDAEDLVQQTFLKLYRYRKRYQPLAKVTTFLFMMARQVWIDEIRRRTRAAKLTEALANEMATDAEQPPETALPEAIDIAGAVAQLSAAMRQVIELVIYQGLNYAEVATILGIPQGTVKSRMFNAIRALRGRLEGREGTDGNRGKYE